VVHRKVGEGVVRKRSHERLLVGWTFPSAERAAHDRAVAAAVRGALGGERYESAHGRGAAMTLDQAIEYAMSDEG
jgi:hypothetical protein